MADVAGVSATRAFTAGNAAPQPAQAFGSVSRVRPARQAPAAIRDATAAADYAASWAGFHQDQVPRPWAGIITEVRQEVQGVIDRDGAFTVSGDSAAFVCRPRPQPAPAARNPVRRPQPSGRQTRVFQENGQEAATDLRPHSEREAPDLCGSRPGFPMAAAAIMASL